MFDCVFVSVCVCRHLAADHCLLFHPERLRERERWRRNERAPRHLEKSPKKTQLDERQALHLSLRSPPPITTTQLSFQ